MPFYQELACPRISEKEAMMIDEKRELTKEAIRDEAFVIGLVVGFVLASIIWFLAFDQVPFL